MLQIFLNYLKQAATGFISSVPLTKLPQVQHQQQLALVHSVASPGHLQAKHN